MFSNRSILPASLTTFSSGGHHNRTHHTHHKSSYVWKDGMRVRRVAAIQTAPRAPDTPDMEAFINQTDDYRWWDCGFYWQTKFLPHILAEFKKGDLPPSAFENPDLICATLHVLVGVDMKAGEHVPQIIEVLQLPVVVEMIHKLSFSHELLASLQNFAHNLTIQPRLIAALEKAVNEKALTEGLWFNWIDRYAYKSWVVFAGDYNYSNIRDGKRIRLSIKSIHGYSLPAADNNGLSDPFIKIGQAIGEDQLEFKKLTQTPVIPKNLNPTWTFPDGLEVEAISHYALSFAMYDKDFIGSDFLGCCAVNLEQLRELMVDRPELRVVVHTTTKIGEKETKMPEHTRVTGVLEIVFSNLTLLA